MQGGLRRFLIRVSVFALQAAGVGYAWTFTPSYSLYHIRHAFLAHDYAVFVQIR